MIKNIDILINGLYRHFRAPGAAFRAFSARERPRTERTILVHAHQNGESTSRPPIGQTASAACAMPRAPGGEKQRNFSAFMGFFRGLWRGTSNKDARSPGRRGQE
jgi:hypothetical protein